MTKMLTKWHSSKCYAKKQLPSAKACLVTCPKVAIAEMSSGSRGPKELFEMMPQESSA